MLHSIYKKNAVNCVFETAFNSGWSLLPQQVTYVDLQVFPNSGKGGGGGGGGGGCTMCPPLSGAWSDKNTPGQIGFQEFYEISTNSCCLAYSLKVH